MEFFETVTRRESCRSYDPKRPAEREKLEKCVEAGRLAPSARNTQPWRFIVVTEPSHAAAVRRSTQLSGANPFTDNVSSFILIESERERAPIRDNPVKDLDFMTHDIGLAAAHITLAAAAQGLSTCMIGWFDPAVLRDELGLSSVYLIISVGYAASGDLKPKRRRAPENVIQWL